MWRDRVYFVCFSIFILCLLFGFILINCCVYLFRHLHVFVFEAMFLSEIKRVGIFCFYLFNNNTVIVCLLCDIILWYCICFKLVLQCMILRFAFLCLLRWYSYKRVRIFCFYLFNNDAIPQKLWEGSCCVLTSIYRRDSSWYNTNHQA